MKCEPLGHAPRAGTPWGARWWMPRWKVPREQMPRDHEPPCGDGPEAPAPAPPLPPPSPAPVYAPSPRSRGRSAYVTVLTWAFVLFTTARLLAYAPTVLAIVQTRDSSQHSLWTWLTWLGANTTMAAWLYEHNGQRLDKAIGVNLSNAAACGFTTIVILWFR